MPEYRWSRFEMCFCNKEKAQYDRKYKSNFNYHFFERMCRVAKYFFRIISWLIITKQG